MKELEAIVAHLCLAGTGGVLATLTKVDGSSYRRPGARMLVTGEAKRIGSISGGCLEEDLIERSARVAASGRAELVVYDTSAENDLLWGVGLGCNGVVRVLLEPLPRRPQWALTVAENLRAGRPTDLAVVWENPGGPVGTHLRNDATPARPGPKACVFNDRIDPRSRYQYSVRATTRSRLHASPASSGGGSLLRTRGPRCRRPSASQAPPP